MVLIKHWWCLIIKIKHQNESLHYSTWLSFIIQTARWACFYTSNYNIKSRNKSKTPFKREILSPLSKNTVSTVSFRCQKETGRPPADSWKHAACGAFNSDVYAPLTKQKKPTTLHGLFLETFSLPSHFAMSYQDKVRNEVINAKTVATVPFRASSHFTITLVHMFTMIIKPALFILKSSKSSTLVSQLKQSIGERSISDAQQN